MKKIEKKKNDLTELRDDEEAVNNHWGVIKTHYISHFRSDIERSGVSQNYCTEMFENLHQKVVIDFYKSCKTKLFLSFRW